MMETYNLFGKILLLFFGKRIKAHLVKLYSIWMSAKFMMTISLMALFMCPLSVSAFPLQSDNFTFSHLGLANGLYSQRIYSLKQTDDGAVWLTSKYFIARYNGVNIESFYLSGTTEGTHLSERNLRFVQSADKSLQVFDERGHIYAFNAVQRCFDLVADASALFKHDNQLNDVYKQGDAYWLAMSEGVYLLRHDSITPVASHIYANCIISGPDGRLLFGTRQGLKSLESRFKGTKRWWLRSYLPYIVVSGHYDVDTKHLWLGTYNQGLIMADRKGAGTPVDGIPHFPVRSIVGYDAYTMLVGVNGCGVYQVSRLPSVGSTARLLFNANEGYSGVLHGNGIYALLVDTWSDIFIGSYSGGIDIARPMWSAVTIYMHRRNDEQSLANDHINCVAQLSSSVLAMGTDDGVSIFTPTTGEWRHVARGMVVLSLCPKPDGSGFLAATYGDGVCEISAGGGVRTLYGANELGDEHIHALLFDRSGHLWIGCQDARLAEVTPDGIRYYPVDNVKSLAMLPDGRIAVGTIKGLYLVTPEKGKVEKLRFHSSSPSSNCYVQDIFVHNERYLYIATDGCGLFVYDLRNGKSRQYTMKGGLPSNSVSSIAIDNLGRLWFATDRGLSFAYPGRLGKITNANNHYGLLREYSPGAVMNMLDGNLIFGSFAGAVVINPYNVQILEYTAPLHFLGVRCNDKDNGQFKEEVAEMLGKGKLCLPYSQRTFELYIEAINLRYQFDVAYQYKVGNDSWSPLSTQQFIRFVNLEPGTHHLVVRAVSLSTHAVVGEKRLAITIGHPWWNTWWMRCVYVSLLILLFYGAWWIYGLHTRYMRLVLSTLGHDGHDSASSSPSKQSEDKVKSYVSTHNDIQLERSAEDTGSADTQLESVFVDKVTKLLLNHISDSEFTIDDLCREMAMSRTMFYLKLKSFTGKSPQEFIRIVRLERAAVLLRAGHRVGDVAGEVGFDNAKYFSTSFKKYFNISPSKYK